jgi:hypothetical protein
LDVAAATAFVAFQPVRPVAAVNWPAIRPVDCNAAFVADGGCSASTAVNLLPHFEHLPTLPIFSAGTFNAAPHSGQAIATIFPPFALRKNRLVRAIEAFAVKQRSQFDHQHPQTIFDGSFYPENVIETPNSGVATRAR